VGSAVDDPATFRAEKVSPAGGLAAMIIDMVHSLLLVARSLPTSSKPLMHSTVLE
jgi:hypothetical protein